MKYRHTFQVRAPLADVASFHTTATSLKAITPPLIPMQLHHAPQQMGDGDEMDFTMWMGPLPVRWAAGLTSAALLARAGLDVTVLEAHVYAGGPMNLVAQAVGIDRWPVRRDDLAMVVHLPCGASIIRHGGEQRWDERRRASGSEAESFWRWLEATSDALWDLALRLPTWPPQTLFELAALLGHELAWLGNDPRQRLKPGLAVDAARSVAAHLHHHSYGAASEPLP